MEKPTPKDSEYIFYESQLKQNASLKLTDEQVKVIVQKIKNSVHNEGLFFQFAYDPNSKEKSVLTKKKMKAFEEAFLINHVSIFNVKEARRDLERNERMLQVFETIVGDQDIRDKPSLSNQRPSLTSMARLELLREGLRQGRFLGNCRRFSFDGSTFENAQGSKKGGDVEPRV